MIIKFHCLVIEPKVAPHRTQQRHLSQKRGQLCSLHSHPFFLESVSHFVMTSTRNISKKLKMNKISKAQLMQYRFQTSRCHQTKSFQVKLQTIDSWEPLILSTVNVKLYLKENYFLQINIVFPLIFVSMGRIRNDYTKDKHKISCFDNRNFSIQWHSKLKTTRVN